ncbi:hypothetical protein AZE42_05467 [Rhizopogon vesiculosus]|uniref:Uncharacterized protein n=1 Tax=Rhizopogon vesiculosus TaxID=180088 RepID=A0A1J8PJC3_9AGAM|nr:hypothetical protein AZE42_05467 [Rhizopogon vesiculosus]
MSLQYLWRQSRSYVINFMQQPRGSSIPQSLRYSKSITLKPDDRRKENAESNQLLWSIATCNLLNSLSSIQYSLLTFHVQDQVDRISSLFDAHLDLLADVRELYRDRAALEREYAVKLQQLAKKASEKKNKHASLLAVGDNPTKTSKETNTIIPEDSGWTRQSLCRTHKGKMIGWFCIIHLTIMIQSKQKYDADCAEVEVCRQKQSGHVHDRHAERSAREYDQQRLDMFNSKNAYIISIAVANSVKTKFYTKDLPSLEDSLQELQTRLVMDFVTVATEAQNIQVSHQDILKDRLATVSAALSEVRPDKDQALFVDSNVRPFSLPEDWVFEPCSSHYDTGDICVDSAPKVILQNKLARSRAKLKELDPVLENKRSEAEKYRDLVTDNATDNALGDVGDAINTYLDIAHEVTSLSTSACVLKSEIDTIAVVLGGDEGGSNPHTFKSSAFSIPTICGYCKVSIWGLSKQGKTCKSCGLSVHSKCELKVPAECSNVRGVYEASEILQSPSSAVFRSESRSSTSSGEAPTLSAYALPHASLRVKESIRLARVIFDFAASSSFELNVIDGTLVHVLEEDDGSGWVKVVDPDGNEGLVPATYLDDASEGPIETSEPFQQKLQQASGMYVRALYDYRARGPDELTINEGDFIELSSGANGGQNYADGWWEGMESSGLYLNDD